MKKILHLFRDPSHDALWSRYLRMLTLIVLFAFGSHGVWGKTQSVSLENMTPSEKGGKCTWTSNSRTLEWSAKTDNLVKIPGLEGDFSSYYNGNIIFSYSGLSDNAKFRVIITKKVGNDETTYEYHFSSTTDGKAKDVVIPIKDFTIQWDSTKITANDLTNVSRIAVAGYDTESGSVSFGTTFTITTSSSAMAMSMKGFQHTSGNEDAQWDAQNLKFSWTKNWNNFLDLWKYSNLEDLSAYYGGSFIYKASKISDNDDTKHRLIIRCYAEDGSNKKDFLYSSVNATVNYTTIPLSEFKDNGTSISPTDLKNVKKIMILGNSSSGALTLGETFTLVAKEDKYKSGIIDAKVGDRNYQIYVPEGIENTTNLKLLFTLHGRGNSYKFTENGVPNFTDQADADQDVIIVSPQGTNHVWNAYTDKSNQTQINEYNKDFQFLKSIILALTKTGAENPTYNGNGQVTIDRTKVFTVGFSNGGMMSYALVTNHPDVFAAGGSVSGLPVNQYALHKSNGHPVPFIHFQGKNDGYVRYEQSAQHIKNWVAYNGCGNATATTGTYDQATAADYYVEYTNGKVPFKFYGINGAGHQANMTYSGISSSQLIWDFIKGRKLGGTAVDMTVVWCPELSVLNGKLSNAWGATADNYNPVTNNETAPGNQGINDRICFEKGRHQLRFTANGTVKIRIYKKGASEVMLYKQNNTNGSEVGFDFDITEAGDYVVEITRADGVKFDAFGIYKLDLPIESTILDGSNVPTIENGVAKYPSVNGGQSTVKYMNVDMSNYNSVDVSCSSLTGDFYLHYPTDQNTKLNNGITKISNISQSGEITLASHGGSSIDINYLRLGYMNSLSGTVDVNENDFAVYDLTKITSEDKGGGISVSYDSNKSEATFTKNAQYNNLVDLKIGRNGALGSGIRFHYMGSKFRVIVTVDEKDYTCFIPENKSPYWATRHLSWKDDFKLNIEQISKISKIRIGGTSENANSEEFKILHIWFDDVDDYNRTFVCYGYENGLAGDQNTYTYTLGSAKATFSNFGWGNFKGGNMCLQIPASGTVTISNTESHTKYTGIKLFFDQNYTYNLTCGNETKSGTGGSVEFNTNAQSLTITNNSSSPIFLSKIEFTTSYEVLDKFTLNVDGTDRNYWLYVPSSAANKKDVPVIFSLHGRQENGANPYSTDAPNFLSVANSNGVIVVLPEGQNIYDDNTVYGWDATGEENADTKFIQALVKEIQTKYASQNSSNGNISVDPKRFYLCGFSEGGSMTYACAKVLNGTFAAYGSCGGFPLNEFHLNLATKQPVPFIHLHGDKDDKFGINHLHTIIENLLFRNGCSLVYSSNVTDQYKKYDFTGVNDVPVTTVTFKGHGHAVHASAPQYLWDFFSDKIVGKYDDTDIEWKWDMPTINANIPNSSSDSPYYGWKHEVNDKDRSLTYGGESKTDSNHNVYNSIQLTAGKHTLYAQMESTQGTSSVTLRNILTGAETVARKIVDNSGSQQATTYNVLYEFEVGEGAEFSLILKRSDVNSRCSLLEIHKGSYRPEGVKDQSQDNASIDLENGKLAELTFEKDEKGEYGVDITPITEKYTENGVDQYKVDNSSDNGNMKLYLISRLGIHDGAIDNKDKYIVKDTVFGHYFQNIPDADIYDRYGASDYMRVVLGTNNSLSGHDGIEGIQTTGKVTIGFWVNGDLAVNRGLAYDEPSMFYIAGNTYNGPNKEDNPHMFNITCSGGLSGYMKGGEFKYNSGRGSFGGLCDTKSNADFYNKNFYKDCNWHYITYQMYDNLSRYNMYVDGEPTCLGGYATHNAGSLDSYIAGLNSIVLGGANANNVTFAYDVAFAYDDIVIYNRVLSKREINKIIENKKYSPSVWNFDQNLESNIFFNKDNLNNTMWTSSAGVYTLNTNFTQAAALTYDGITEIPAFKGLRFVTNDASKIAIDAKSGALRLSQGVKMIFSNMVKDNYVRMEYKHQESDIWVNYNNQNMNQIVGIPSVNEEYDRAGFKITGAGDGKENSITMPSDIEISAIEATDKYFAQIKFVDRQNTSQVKSVVENPKDTLDLPRMDLYINNVERLHKADPETGHKFSYTSSSPHVASVDSITGVVKLHGVSGSTVITAELDNSKRKYDCDIYDEYAFEPSNRIFASYEIVVSPKTRTSKVIEDNKSYSVGETIYNDENTIGVTLGGWTYNNGSYYEKTDSFSMKEPWAGQKFEKNANRKGYKPDSRKTEENVFAEIFTEGNHTFSTNGSHPAKSEQLTAETNTGNYSAPAGNKSVANKTPWLLPCRGSHIKIEPTDAGLISVYVMQEGCVSHDDQDEPIDVTVKKVYVADEKGEIVKQVVADTKSKVAAQMWKDDGRARAEYVWGKPEYAYNEATMTSFLKINDWHDQWSFLDNWPNPGMQQHVFKLGEDEDGHVLITKGIVRYTFNVLPGKTYYIFSNTAKLGLAGFTFEKGKHAIYKKVKPDAKHDEWRATGEFVDVSDSTNVELKDEKNYSVHTEKNAIVTLHRKFYKNYWNAICLPYSINRRQIEQVFGDGTMVVLMKNIDTSNKKVMFIEHANQDIIAGYPYLIFPTDKADNDKTNHSVIKNGIITTRATFGEADSPIFTVGTDGTTYADGTMQQNALVFKGTFSKEELPVGSYVITKSGTLANVPKTGLTINPYRAYIHFNKTTSEAKAIKLASMGFAGFDDMEGETTSIEDLLFNDGIMTRPADVFTVNGQKVRSKAKNLYGLPKGVYIVNGKKYVNK
ncbi:MAG: alpha/beta hydrolase-fold protein [Prevotella sp.]|nr:alpha/beta hydrolase-fold protein [Prevotella sp.]